MKRIFVSTTCVLAFATVGAVIFSVHSSKQNSALRSQWQSESKASKSKLDDLAGIIESNKESIAAVENKVFQLSNDLNKSVGQLSAANEKIQAYALAEQNRQDEERKKYLASVPEPTLIGKVFVFPKVVGIHNEILATNAAFAYIAGRRLVFRPGNLNSVVADVDDVHPLMLKYLGIDGEAVKESQRKVKEQAAADAAALAEANRAQAGRDRQAWEAGAPAREAKRIADAQLAIEQQKADAALRAADAAQQQAQADKEKADALMRNASNPPQQINVIQQQVQQVQQRPQPRGYIENNGVMVPYY
jgi:hypothetical protein